VADRIIYSGDAGTRFTNDTGKVLYQFIAALQNTCGVCLQYHLKISRGWPIPIHYNCRCIQRLVKPGADAPHEFVDYRKLLDGFDESQKTAAIGASNYRLLKSGLATWDDIVTPNRVRDFREVVAKKRLSVETMTKHGVSRYQATKAYDAVHTTEHQHAERQRAALLKNLTAAGVSHDTLVGELSKRLAGRVTIAAGPTGAMVGRPQDVGGPAWGGGRLPGTGPSSAGELAKLISGWRPPKPPIKPKTPAAAPVTVEKPKPEPAPVPKAPLAPGNLETIEDVQKWMKVTFPKAEITTDGIPADVWNSISRDLGKLAKEYPAVAEKLERIGTNDPLWGKGKHARAIARADNNEGKFLNFNPHHWSKPEAIANEVKTGSESGWFVKGISDPNYIVSHEWGHLVDAHLKVTDQKKWIELRQVFSDKPSELDWNKAVQVSRYAATNRLEAIAETFAAARHQPKAMQPQVVRDFMRVLAR
jgi:hypothetical protein